MFSKMHRCFPLMPLALLALLPQLARAHAVLVKSTPRPNEAVHGSTLKIDLKFNSRVDGARSTVQIAAADRAIKTLSLAKQMAPDEIVTQADGLSKGSYTLRWQALASDGHITRGEIPFQVQ